MVQEVERGHTELHLVMFLEGEVLVNRKVAVEESGPLDVRPNDVPVLSSHWSRETGRGEELVGTQTLRRRAGQQRCRGGSDTRTRTQVVRRLHAGWPPDIECPAGVGLKRRPALPLCDSRNHPAVRSE